MRSRDPIVFNQL